MCFTRLEHPEKEILQGMNTYHDLLLHFHALPREAKARTFMEVSGQAHYENVASNVLAFYFDPNEEHGLGDLLITAFLESVRSQQQHASPVPKVAIPASVSVTREYPAENTKRIDLVINCDTFTFGIENKIYHWEANDFANYARIIDSLGEGKTLTLKVVLGLRADAREPLPPGGFLRVSYAQLWKEVRKSLGGYLRKANPKWVTYLIDFMETTSRLAGESQANHEFTDFFLKHHTVIEELFAERQALINRLATYNGILQSNLRSELERHESIIRSQAWGSNVFAVDFLIQGHTVVLDLARWDVVWRLTVFDRSAASTDFLRRLASTGSMREGSSQIRPDDGRYLVEIWDLHVTLVELQDAVLKWVHTILAAAAELALPAQTKTLQ